MHTSCFIFFANELLFAHFIPILDYGNDIRQKAILSNFFFTNQPACYKMTGGTLRNFLVTQDFP